MTPALRREQAPGKASPSAMSNAGEEGDVPLPARLLGTWGGNASLSKEGSTDSPPPSPKKKKSPFKNPFKAVDPRAKSERYAINESSMAVDENVSHSSSLLQKKVAGIS